MDRIDVPIPAELKVLPRRRATAHKGDFGRLLVVAGSRGMHGAAALCAAAAFRSGAGLVTVAVPESVYPLAGAAELRATWLLLPEQADGALAPRALPALLAAAGQASVVALGPGVSRRAATVEVIRAFVPRVERPLVVDADGLNAFEGDPTGLAASRPAMIATPHPGELFRLTGQRAGHDDASRRLAAIDLAMRVGGVVVLKGHRSVVTDGIEVFFNPTGTPAMASGGVGDVLTGCLAAVLAVLPDPLLAARVATFAHGLAGDLARARWGEIGVTALDVIECLPRSLGALVEDAGERR